MASKKFQFTFLICIPLFWIFYKLIPSYINPAASSTVNFIYAENFENLKIWCFDKSSNIRFDDSSNFLYSLALWFFIHFFKFTVVKAAIYVNGISLFFSVFLLHKIIDSRFISIQLLVVGFLFMSTQLWAGVLGDEIIFQGMLWLFAIRAFWSHNYFWLMIWTVVNIIARPDNIFILLPLIVASFSDINELKQRYKRKFIYRRIRRTLGFLIFPVLGYFSYRYIYFGKVLPYNWYHHTLEIDKKYGVFNNQGFYFGIHYLRFYVFPLVIGVLFYFLKERKILTIRYYALAISFIAIPFLYNCTFSQDENLAFKNQYAIYLGLVILTLLFIRNFRSLSQGLTVSIFIFFFGFKTAFNFFQKTLQSDKDNSYYIANDLAEIKNGKAIVSYDNHLAWLSNWQILFSNGKHTKVGEDKSDEIIKTTTTDIIITENYEPKELQEKYDVYILPKSTRLFEKEIEPENSVDKFFYKHMHQYKIDRQETFSILVWKFGNNYSAISKIVEKHGGKKL